MQLLPATASMSRRIAPSPKKLVTVRPAFLLHGLTRSNLTIDPVTGLRKQGQAKANNPNDLPCARFLMRKPKGLL
jgi:hypothetical protein